ncbi:hypothetical protein Dda_0848 [Drechslerella dactyloides]|uniref:Uncharacterized protein n=1 Tax=Drechslerella dactyloides TaxID=74499 RepID=A0AAD6NPC3_DREDA|nr:hypothetical protein Dda_0848 [Drechslerella dactyloides]
MWLAGKAASFSPRSRLGQATSDDQLRQGVRDDVNGLANAKKEDDVLKTLSRRDAWEWMVEDEGDGGGFRKARRTRGQAERRVSVTVTEEGKVQEEEKQKESEKKKGR